MITILKAQLSLSEKNKEESQSAHESSSFLEKTEQSCSKEDEAIDKSSLNTEEKIDQELKRQMEQLVERKAELMRNSAKMPNYSPIYLHDVQNVADLST